MLIRQSLKDLFCIMKFIKPRMLKYLVGLFGHSAVEANIYIVMPFITKYMIDGAINGDVSLLEKGLIIAGVEAVLMSVGFAVFGYLFQTSISRTMTDIRLKLFIHVTQLPISYFEQNHSGEIISRTTNDIGAMESAYSWQLRQTLFIAITGVGSAIAMVILNWKMGIILVVFGVLSAFINMKFISIIKGLEGKKQKGMAKLTESMLDAINGFSIIKMFHIEDIIIKIFSDRNSQVYSFSKDSTNKSAKLDSINYLVSWLNFSGIIAVGAILVINKEIEFGTVIALMSLLGYLNSMIRSLGATLAQFQNALSGAKRIVDLFKEPVEPENHSIPSAVETKNTTIHFNDIEFSYDESRVILSNLNISIKGGQITALVGSSGGGKSTIVKLLLGFYQPKSGRISINGKSMKEISLFDLRGMMAYVPQDSHMFDGTIEENIGYGNCVVDKKEVIAAAKAANAHDFIEELPDGYNTNVGERGIKLSGGQRQRIAIARAILKNAPILLLDEATSALDSQNEQLVQNAIEKLMRDRTVVTIAHRLSTIENADIIYVIENGTVIEQGRHVELIKKNGTYKMFYDLQFHTI